MADHMSTEQRETQVETVHTQGWPCGGRIKCPACCAESNSSAPTPDYREEWNL